MTRDVQNSQALGTSSMRPAALTLKSALVGIGLAIVATAATTGVAKADSFSFGFSLGDRHGPSIHGHFGERPVYRQRDRVRRHACSPRRALHKARNAGVRRARLVRYGPRGSVIKGRYRGDRVIVRVNNKCRIRRIAYR